MKNMKKKFLLPVLALGLTSTLNASSFFTDSEAEIINKHYKQFHNELIKFFGDEGAFGSHYKQYKNNLFIAYPKMNAFENEENYTFEFELAGIDKKDIKVTINDQNILTISGTKKGLSKEEKENIIRQEQHFGSFSRSLSLPEDANSQDIKVKYDNGILKVIVARDKTKQKEKIRTLKID